MRVKAFFTLVGMVIATYYFSLFMEEKLEARLAPAPVSEAEAATPGE